MKHCRHFIDGTLRDPAHDRWLDVHEPATGQVLAQVAAGDASDVAAAVAAAQQAFPQWSTLPNEARAHWLEALANALESRLEVFAQAE